MMVFVIVVTREKSLTSFDTWVKEDYSHKILSFVVVVTEKSPIFFNRLERGISTPSS